jgi:bifunctional NMN adenylyltransferase/nudix hydrolase
MTVQPTQKQFDLVVVIGRFQPFHNGHKSLVDHALSIASNVLVICGSANKPSSSKNPWSFLDRDKMVRSVYPGEVLDVTSINDYLYDDLKWVRAVTAEVEEVIKYRDLSDTASIALMGHFKDHSSYYLPMFPGWELIEGPSFEGINATGIRESLFNGANPHELPVPVEVANWLDAELSTERYMRCKVEHRAIQREKKKKSGYPYDLNEVTVDAVVVHKSGKILLVKRGGSIGKGLWALPGGFLNKNERLYDGCVRELLEETQINLVPPAAQGALESQESADWYTKSELKRCFVRSEMFDHPDRSIAGRRLTVAHLFVLDTPYLPVIKGGDDASEAVWHPLGLIESDYMHDDHADIIQTMTRG